MNFIKRFLYLLLFVLIAFFGVTFTIKNPQSVELNYYFGIHWEQPITMFLLGSLVIGVLIGICVSSYFVLRMKGKLMHSNRNIGKAEKELEELRALNTKKVSSNG